MTDNGVFPEENGVINNQSSQTDVSLEDKAMESAQLPASTQSAAPIASVRNFQIGQGQIVKTEKKSLF